VPLHLGLNDVGAELILDLEEIQNAPHRHVVALAAVLLLGQSVVLDQAVFAHACLALPAPFQHLLGGWVCVVEYFLALLACHI